MGDRDSYLDLSALHGIRVEGRARESREKRV